VLLQDAVKRALPDGAPKPGAFRKGAEEQKQAQSEAAPEAPVAEMQPAEGGDSA
jgi:hypothetical protein